MGKEHRARCKDKKGNDMEGLQQPKQTLEVQPIKTSKLSCFKQLWRASCSMVLKHGQLPRKSVKHYRWLLHQNALGST